MPTSTRPKATKVDMCPKCGKGEMTDGPYYTRKDQDGALTGKEYLAMYCATCGFKRTEEITNG